MKFTYSIDNTLTAIFLSNSPFERKYSLLTATWRNLTCEMLIFMDADKCWCEKSCWFLWYEELSWRSQCLPSGKKKINWKNFKLYFLKMIKKIPFFVVAHDLVSKVIIFYQCIRLFVYNVFPSPIANYLFFHVIYSVSKCCALSHLT